MLLPKCNSRLLSPVIHAVYIYDCVTYDSLLVLTSKVVHLMVYRTECYCTLPFNNESFLFVSEPAWCPYLLVPRASLALKAFLLHQPWNEKYSLDVMTM